MVEATNLDRVTFNITKNENQYLTEMTELLGMNKTDVIRAAIRRMHYLETQREANDAEIVLRYPDGSTTTLVFL